MNYISLFTGIGGFDLAFNRAGHHCVAMVERDKAAQAVLRARFPGVPLFDDVVTFGRKDIDGSVDIVVGGSPCQSFSVAGLRKSLGDDRGNLAFEFCRIVDEFTPRWVVWENVPGVLSTKDNAFGNFLAALVGEDAAIEPPGKRWPNAGMVAGPARTAAWRILDAQYFGVAQRRRRVFVVAGTGAERVAPVLFESEGVRRDSPPRRETRQGVAGTISGRIARSHTELDGHGAYVYQHASGGGDDFKDTAQALRSGAEHSYQVVYDARGNGDGTLASAVTGDHGNRVTDYTAVVIEPRYYTRDNKTGGAPSDVASITNAHKAGDSAPVVVQAPATSSALKSEGADASEDGTGRHALIVRSGEYAQIRAGATDAVMIHSQGDQDANAAQAGAGKALRLLRNEIGEKAFTQWALGVVASLQPQEALRMGVLDQGERKTDEARAEVVGRPSQGEDGVSSREMREVWQAGRERRASQGWQLSEQLTAELGAHLQVVSQRGTQTDSLVQGLWQASEGIGVLREALSAVQEVRESATVQAEPAQPVATVRRLTAKECERLQALPDGWTAQGMKPDGTVYAQADTPRYKQLGNAVCVNVVEWIARRLQ